MLSVLMLSLLIPVTDVADMPMTAFSQQDDPPVKLWLSKDRVQLGDRVRVDVRTESDGYLLVLHAEPDGRVRVLFPIDPIHDNFVRGGDEFEVRGRGDRETFRIYSSEGVGTVYAAFSRDPFQFEEFVRGDHWDYGVRDVWYVLEDPEPEITDLVLSLASGAYFDYDFVQYGVGDAMVAARRQTNLSLYADPYYYGSYNVGINIGRYYDPVWQYRGLWRMGYTGWPSYRYGCWHSSWSCFDPFHYNYYDPWYYGGGYGYGGYYGYGYGGYYGYGNSYYPTYRTPVVVYGNSRLRTTLQTRMRPSNGDNRGRRVYAGTLGSAVRRTSAVSRVSPAAKRLASTNVTGSRTPQRATASTGRRVVDSPRATPTRRATTATARRTTDAARRSVNATAQQPQRRTTSQATTTRQASPTRATVTARRVTTTRQATPTRQKPVTTRRATPNRATASRPVTTRSTPVRSSRPATSRSTPVRSSRPTTSRSTPVRSSRPATSRSTPVRSSRPSTSRSAPVRSSRPATSRSAPVRSSRPATSRSAPVRSSRPSTSRSTPVRSSRPATSRKPAATSSSSRRRKP